LSDRIEKIVNVILAVSAVVVAVSFAYREFGLERRSGQNAAANAELVFVPEWERMIQDGLKLGSASAAIHVVEFADLECPACADWHLSVLAKALRESPDSIAFTMMHFPLPKHRFAKQAAHALECAGAQTRAASFLDAIYAQQDSIGLKSWWSYAAAASVPDSAKFTRCLGGDFPSRIQKGLSWAARLGVGGTPTVLINGWVLASPPDSLQLYETIERLKKRQPLR
jgi:protein-disulfide isomerase